MMYYIEVEVVFYWSTKSVFPTKGVINLRNLMVYDTQLIPIPLYRSFARFNSN